MQDNPNNFNGNISSNNKIFNIKINNFKIQILEQKDYLKLQTIKQLILDIFQHQVQKSNGFDYGIIESIKLY